MSYIDGFVCAVPTENKEKYRKHVEKIALVFKKYGAEKTVDCWGDDVPEGKLTSFPLAVKCQSNETVVFSWIHWPSKKVRDEAMPKIFDDPDCDPQKNPWPMDMKRVIFGGFEILLET